MKPSQRINQIFDELIESCTNTPKSIAIQAIVDYLDEEYEKKKESERILMEEMIKKSVGLN